jgi:hypothetical protein
VADPDAYPILFRRAVAQHLADQGAGVYSAGAYASTDRGIYTNGPALPTTLDNCIVLSWLSPIATGRAGMLYRLQVTSRIKGSVIAAENFAALIEAAMDQKQNVPPGLFVSWCELFSSLALSADSSGRCATIQTFHFTGRRPLA